MAGGGGAVRGDCGGPEGGEAGHAVLPRGQKPEPHPGSGGAGPFGGGHPPGDAVDQQSAPLVLNLIFAHISVFVLLHGSCFVISSDAIM